MAKAAGDAGMQGVWHGMRCKASFGMEGWVGLYAWWGMVSPLGAERGRHLRTPTFQAGADSCWLSGEPKWLSVCEFVHSKPAFLGHMHEKHSDHGLDQ
jgi:hypothetical protein